MNMSLLGHVPTLSQIYFGKDAQSHKNKEMTMLWTNDHCGCITPWGSARKKSVVMFEQTKNEIASWKLRTVSSLGKQSNLPRPVIRKGIRSWKKKWNVGKLENIRKAVTIEEGNRWHLHGGGGTRGERNAAIVIIFAYQKDSTSVILTRKRNTGIILCWQLQLRLDWAHWQRSKLNSRLERREMGKRHVDSGGIYDWNGKDLQ